MDCAGLEDGFPHVTQRFLIETRVKAAHAETDRWWFCTAISTDDRLGDHPALDARLAGLVRIVELRPVQDVGTLVNVLLQDYSGFPQGIDTR